MFNKGKWIVAYWECLCAKCQVTVLVRPWISVKRTKAFWEDWT